MPIPFTCPHCGWQTTVADQFAGQTGNCRQCGNVITIPGGNPLMPVAAQPVQKKSTPMWLLLVVGICGFGVIAAVVGSVVWWGSQGGDQSVGRGESGALIKCNQNLLAISMALSSYHDEYGSLPAAVTTDKAGRPMHSWRVYILPYLGKEGKELYRQYDFSKPWNAPSNKKLIKKMPNVFHCPADKDVAAGHTRYMAIVGDGCAWGINKYVKREDVKDDLRLTILLAEANKTAPWTQPVDIDYKKLSNLIGDRKDALGSMHEEMGAHIVLFDWSIEFLHMEDDSWRVIREGAQIADGDEKTLENLQAIAADRQRAFEQEMREQGGLDGGGFDDPDGGF